MSHSHICRQRQSTAFLCAFACFLSEIWPNPSPFFVRVASYWSEGTKYNTVLTLLHSFSSPFPPFWFAFKEKKFVFWFLHQVSNSTRVSFPPLPYFPFSIWLELLLLCLNISLFTFDTHCNFTWHSVPACVFGLVWLWFLLCPLCCCCDDLPNNLKINIHSVDGLLTYNI